MRQVITIDLNGRLYHLDERGYDELRIYFEHAQAALVANPDRSEIVRDLEQSIGEKLMRYTGPENGVANAADVEELLREIGPVEGTDAAAVPPARDAASSQTRSGAPRRLSLVREGAMIGGVCNGIAEYFTIDPTWVRIAAVLMAVFEMGYYDRPPFLSIGLYVLFLVLIPYSTPFSRQPTMSASISRTVQKAMERVKSAFGTVQHHA
jgi:phage shock protein PspC (stress-responsive transcriptional regulator)